LIPYGLARRGLVLAAVALLGGVLAFAAGSWNDDGGSTTQPEARPVPVPGSGWYRALAAPYPASTTRERTSCGQPLGPRTLGVAHPVLPCGVKLYISYGEKLVLTQVVDRGPGAPGRDFDLTRALAARLGLEGTQQIRWRYAR
jgi:rare lipoprotein A (peptidoglycan hydrolase)